MDKSKQLSFVFDNIEITLYFLSLFNYTNTMLK